MHFSTMTEKIGRIFFASFLTIFAFFWFGSLNVNAAEFLHSHSETCYKDVMETCDNHKLRTDVRTENQYCESCKKNRQCEVTNYFDVCKSNRQSEMMIAAKVVCTTCKTERADNPNPKTMPHQYQTKKLTCNMNEGSPNADIAMTTADSYSGCEVNVIVTNIDKNFKLAKKPYDYGSGYTSSSVHTYTENGNYTISIKDSKGNVATRDITVSCIDKTAPSITKASLSTKEWTTGEVVITVKAKDEKSGLDSKPYSFNGGSYTSSNTYTVKENQSVEISVKDKAGNVASKTVKVSNIDKTGPVFSEETYSTKNWTNQNVTLTVGAKDSGSGLAASPFSYDGGAYTDKNTFSFSGNGKVNVTVVDALGNSTKKTYSVSNIDKAAPSITKISKSTENWTNGNVVITISASDAASGLCPQAYALGNGAFTQSNQFTITENGTYTVKVKDNAGNVASSTVTISNIDKVAPESLKVTKSTNEYTKGSVTVTVTASDSLSKMAAKAYSFNGGSFTDINSLTVSKNGKIKITVKDNAGNTASTEVNVTNIDCDAPVITKMEASKTSWTNSDVVVSVTASDNGVGLAASPYSFNAGTYGTANTIKVTQNSTITVSVKDALSNVASASLKITNIDKTAPVIEGITKSTEGWTSGHVTIKVSAKDSESGLCANAYSFNGGAYGSSNSYEVAANGTVSVSVKDNAGNVTSSSVKVSNIDNTAPSISGIKKSTDSWTKGSVTITVTASDTASGMASAGYSFDGGAYSGNNSYTVSTNKTVSIAVKDNAGNITRESISVSNIDNDAPVIKKLTPSTTGATNEGVTITVDATDSGSGLHKSAYSYNGGSYTSSNTVTVKENGTLNVSVKDALGNVSSSSINVNNIDKVAPVITGILKSHESMGKENVTITVTAKDSESGLAGKAFSFDNGAYSASNKYVVSENGTVNVSVMDAAGNITTGSVKVSNIDKEAPSITKISKSTENWTEKDITITAYATDKISGLSEAPFSLDGSSYQTNGKFTIFANGTYKVYVRDNAGNVSTESITVSNIDKEMPVISRIEKSTDDWTEDGVTITVVASDLGSGLADKPYSYNGGWYSASNTYTVKKNGEVTVSVKDKVGNVTTKSVNITNMGKSPSAEAAEKAAAEKAAAEKAAAEKAAEKAAAEKAAAEKAAAEKAAAEKAATEKAAAEKAAAEKAAAERAEAERAAMERAAEEKAAAEKAAAERAALEKAAAERAEAEKTAAEQAEKERLAKEREALEKAAEERAALEKAAKEKAEKEEAAAKKAAMEKAALEEAAAKKAVLEKAAAEKAAAEKAAAEKAAAEKAAAEKAAAEKAAAEKAAEEESKANALKEAEEKQREEEKQKQEERQKQEEEKLRKEEAERIAAMERAERERIALEKEAQAKLEAEELRREEEARIEAEEKVRTKQERIAAEKAAAEKAAAEKAAAERAEAEKTAAEQAKKERLAKEREALEKAAAERAGLEKEAKEKAAAEKAAQEKAAAEKAATEKAEREKKEQEQVKKEEAKRERAEREKVAAEHASQTNMTDAEKAAREEEAKRLERDQASKLEGEEQKEATDRIEEKREEENRLNNEKKENPSVMDVSGDDRPGGTSGTTTTRKGESEAGASGTVTGSSKTESDITKKETDSFSIKDLIDSILNPKGKEDSLGEGSKAESTKKGSVNGISGSKESPDIETGSEYYYVYDESTGEIVKVTDTTLIEGRTSNPYSTEASEVGYSEASGGYYEVADGASVYYEGFKGADTYYEGFEGADAYFEGAEDISGYVELQKDALGYGEESNGLTDSYYGSNPADNMVYPDDVRISDEILSLDEREEKQGTLSLKVASAGTITIWAGAILLLMGLIVASFFNYIYMSEGGHIKIIALCRIKKEKKCIIVMVPKGKMKTHGKCLIFFSLWTRARMKNRSVYVQIEGEDHIINTDERTTFVY